MFVCLTWLVSMSRSALMALIQDMPKLTRRIGPADISRLAAGPQIEPKGFTSSKMTATTTTAASFASLLLLLLLQLLLLLLLLLLCKSQMSLTRQLEASCERLATRYGPEMTQPLQDVAATHSDHVSLSGRLFVCGPSLVGRLAGCCYEPIYEMFYCPRIAPFGARCSRAATAAATPPVYRYRQSRLGPARFGWVRTRATDLMIANCDIAILCRRRRRARLVP